MNSYLFANPSFLAGMASVLDLGGNLVEYNYSESGEQADYIALLSDWVEIGADMRLAVAAFEGKLITSGQEEAPAATT